MSVSPTGFRSSSQLSPAPFGSFTSAKAEEDSSQRQSFRDYLGRFVVDASDSGVRRSLTQDPRSASSTEFSFLGLSGTESVEGDLGSPGKALEFKALGDSDLGSPGKSLDMRALGESYSSDRILELQTPFFVRRELKLDDEKTLTRNVQQCSTLTEVDFTPDPLAASFSRPSPAVATIGSKFKVYHTQDAEEHQTLSKIASVWGETSRARFMNTRDCLTPSGQATPDDVADDLSQMSDYIDVVKYFSGKSRNGENRHSLALLDAEAHVQGLAKLTEKTDHLYLNALLTAAWNLPQRGETPTKISENIPQAKGCGTALVAAACKVGRSLGFSRLETSPSARAKSFYTNVLEMPYNTASETCVLDLSQDSLPKRIQDFWEVPLVKSARFNIPPSPFDIDSES